MNKPTVVITHHAVSQKHHTVKDVDAWHKLRWSDFVSNRGWWVGYHYVIDWDGTITQTRDHNEEGAHTIGMNKSSIGVCFMGNFDKHLPSPEQMASWKTLYDAIRLEYPDIPTLPHRAYANKSCHGSLLADEYFSIYYNKLKTIDTLRRVIAILTRLVLKRRMK